MNKKDLIYQHEIPDGSKLYFGKSAQLKRRIERVASEILENNGFSEIITPYFSYHQRLSTSAKKLLRLSGANNEELALRSDSTIDVARIVLRRIKNGGNKWFYIQPVFKYPSSEFYQIGAEILGGSDILSCLKMAAELFSKFEIKPFCQISNMEIPRIICELLGLNISVFEEGRLEIILSQNKPWLSNLADIKNGEDIKNALNLVPGELKEPLNLMRELGESFSWENKIYAPLFYSKMRYYDKIFFRFLQNNFVLSGGGSYEIDEKSSVGFAIFSDALIEYLTNLD